jgi:hypothetical protein
LGRDDDGTLVLQTRIEISPMPLSNANKTRRRNSDSLIRKLLKIVMVSFLTLLLLEIVLRLWGIKPQPHLSEEDVKSFAEPFKGYFCSSDPIGIAPCPSQTRTLYQAGKIRYEATHLADGSRYCGYRFPSDSSSRPIILLTGDSHIHGDGVDDANQVGYLLQSALPDYHVINSAIPGSSNVSQLLVLKEALQTYTPQIVIAAYGSYHNHRNICGRVFKKQLLVPEERIDDFKFPYMTYENGVFEQGLTTSDYSPFPLSNYLSICEFINVVLERHEYRDKGGDGVTLEIWRQYIHLCAERGLKLCVVILTEDPTTEVVVRYLIDNGVEVLRTQISDSLTLMPIDMHLNEKGHRYLQTKLISRLDSLDWIDISH